MDETAPDGETGIIQNVDATEQHVKQSSDTAVGTYRSSGSVTQDNRKTNVSPMGASHIQIATKVRLCSTSHYIVHRNLKKGLFCLSKFILYQLFGVACSKLLGSRSRICYQE